MKAVANAMPVIEATFKPLVDSGSLLSSSTKLGVRIDCILGIRLVCSTVMLWCLMKEVSLSDTNCGNFTVLEVIGSALVTP